MIHDLSFGPKYPGIHNPLDGTNRILHDTSGTFKYYIKVFYLNPSLFFSLTSLHGCTSSSILHYLLLPNVKTLFVVFMNPFREMWKHYLDTISLFRYYIWFWLVALWIHFVRCENIICSWCLSVWYGLQIVPTEYRYLSKDILTTNQYSVTEYYTPMNEFDRTWPG